MSGRFWDRGVQLVSGCTKVSEGCEHCWAEKFAARFSGNPCHRGLTTDGRWNGKVRFNLPLLERAAKVKEPQVYAIWNDLFHPGVTDEQIVHAYRIMKGAEKHTWLVITKRLERLFHLSSITTEWYNRPFHNECFGENIWHIATAENQARLEERLDYLLGGIPGKRGVLIEPMLGPVDFSDYFVDMSSAEDKSDIRCYFHQVILGGETGPGARPMNPVGVKSVRDQCKAAEVPFFFKSWGEWLPVGQSGDGWGNIPPRTKIGYFFGIIPTAHIGHKRAGRLLDGREHNDLAWHGGKKF